jgi:hypothetical protein
MTNPFITLAAIITQNKSASELAEYASKWQKKVFIETMVDIKKNFVTKEEVAEQAKIAFEWWNPDYKGE